MNVRGKFYLYLNQASVVPWFWNQKAQNWTSVAHDATFFDTRGDADTEAAYATAYCDQHGLGEVIVRQATRNLPAREAA